MAGATPNLTLAIEGKEYPFEDLTLDDLEAIEEEFGTSFAEVDWMRAKAMKFLVWLLRRQDDPEFTREAAGRVKVSVFLDSKNGAAPESPPLPEGLGVGEPGAAAKTTGGSGLGTAGQRTSRRSSRK